MWDADMASWYPVGCGMLTSLPGVQADVAALESQVRSASGDVDMFLTCEWPVGVTDRLPKGAAPQEIDDSGSNPGTHTATCQQFFWLDLCHDACL
jgi:hypothetical protein